MDDKLNGRREFVWQALSFRDVRQWEEDLNALADIIVKLPGIYIQDRALVWLNEGKLIPVTTDVLQHEIFPKHIVSPRLVNRDGNWSCEYVPFAAPIAALRTMLATELRREGSLLARAMKA